MTQTEFMKKNLSIYPSMQPVTSDIPHSWLMVDGKRQPSMVSGWANRFALANMAKNLL